MKCLEVKKDIYWVGALDPDLRIFDIIMYTPFGTTYNSYVIRGSEKTAVMETVKEQFFEEYLERLRSLDINIENIDYIVVNHTEPDHVGSVAKLLKLSKNAKVVGSSTAIKFLKAIVNEEFEYIIVKDGDTLSLGNKTLSFISAPQLHWPDTMYTYVAEDSMLFTCDSFGVHYCTDKIFNDLIEDKKDYYEALRYYFDCIISPFKPYVIKAVDKIKDLNIDMICPGHGPILREDPKAIVELYREWATPDSTTDKATNITICYVSAYGYTKSIASKIAEGIKASDSSINIDSYDVTYSKIEEVMEAVEKADGLLFGSPTILSDALKPILDILTTLNPIIHNNKVAAAFGSYGWSGEAVPNIEARLKQLRLKLMTPGLKINFKPSEEDFTAAFQFGESFAAKVKEHLSKGVKPVIKTTSKLWRCIVCGFEIEGNEPPEVCVVCGAGKDAFIQVKLETIDFNKESSENFVIVGNGAAGYYAADAIRKRNKKCSINIISAENHITYFRPQLSDYLSKSIPDNEFYVSPESWYKDNHIKLTLNTMVEKISTENNRVILNSGEEILYDKLIIATGSHNHIPVIIGANKPSVFSLKDLDDANNIKLAMKTSRDVVIIGGGLLGLEAAAQMKKSGVNVTVVELYSRLLPRQLDEEGAELFKKAAANSGVNFILGDCLDKILGEDKVTEIKLKSGLTIKADLVLFSVGIRANKILAQNSGINNNNGILVNDKMETNIQNIYACGDVAELNGRIYGNWVVSTEMGKIAGANAAGDDSVFQDIVCSTAFNAMDIQLFSTGELSSRDNNLVEYSIKNSTKNLYKKLFFIEDKIVGGILMGDTKKSVKLSELIQAKRSMSEVIKENILY